MLEAGRQIGRYRILSAIGEGGMGVVYLAADTVLPRNVALKVLPEDIASNKERLGRFEREAHAVSVLNHPNILTIYEFGTEADVHYIATEFVDGITLRDELRSGQMPLADILAVAEQTALALAAAHSAGIVHRDIKPENIMIRGDRIVKVLDFGLAKLAEPPSHPSGAEDPTKLRTDPGVVLGTVTYMSPEQAKGKPVDERTDIWSLGAVIYEMVRGTPAFDGESANEVIASILTSEPEPLASVPRDLERIIKRSLRKNPDERYQSVKDLLIDIRELRQEFVSETMRPPAGGVANEHRTGTPDQRSTVAVGAAATAGDIHATSSAEYVATGIMRHKLGFGIALALVVFLAAGLGYRYYQGRSLPAGQLTSVAVLPFENGRGDASLDYLSDGISESLIDRLSQLPQIKVIARNSSFKFRGADIDLKSAAASMGVQALVTGKVTRVGDGLTIRVEMIDPADNRQLWSEQYNRKSADMLALQQDIALAASEKLRIKLSGAQEQSLADAGTSTPAAYELLLRGRYLGNTPGPGNRQKAVELLNQAIAIDPNYALAYAELTRSYSLLINNSIGDPKVLQPKAELAARKAVELDPNLAEAHLAMARIYTDLWNWAASEKEYKRAIELKSNLGSAHGSYSAYLSSVGRYDEAIAEAKLARDLDPLSLGPNVQVAQAFYQAGRFDEAIAAAPRVMEISKPWGYMVLGYANAGKGAVKDAIDNYEASIREGNPSPSIQIYLGAAYARSGETEKARAILAKLENSKDYVSPGELAILYGALGDKDAAFRSLEKGYTQHDAQLKNLTSDAAYTPLRPDPRFTDLVARVGLPH
jgi:serine/threonine-protein kinase